MKKRAMLFFLIKADHMQKLSWFEWNLKIQAKEAPQGCYSPVIFNYSWTCSRHDVLKIEKSINEIYDNYIVLLITFFAVCIECSSHFLWVPFGMALLLAITWPSWWFHLLLLLKYEWRKPSNHICHQNFVTAMTGWAGFSITVPWSILAVDLCCFNLSHAWQLGKACTLLDMLSFLHSLWFLC